MLEVCWGFNPHPHGGLEKSLIGAMQVGALALEIFFYRPPNFEILGMYFSVLNVDPALHDIVAVRRCRFREGITCISEKLILVSDNRRAANTLSFAASRTPKEWITVENNL
jgi:hypothetical protein